MAIKTFVYPGVAISSNGLATEAKQDIGNTSLSSINTKLTTTVNGLKVDGSAVTQPVSASSLPLPTGAATETTLGALNTKVTTTVNGVRVDGSAVTQPVSAASLPLPTGAATETTLNTLNGKFGTLGQKTAIGSAPVVLASDQSAIPVTGPLTDTQLRATAVPVSGPLTDTQLRAAAVPVSGPLTDVQLRATAIPVSGPLTDVQLRATAVPVSAASLPLPTGAATEATLAAISTKTPALGQAVAASSSPVVIASNQSVLPVQSSGRSKVAIYRQDYAVTSVTTAAYTQLIASTSAAINKIQIFDSSGNTMVLAVGAAAAEVDQFYIFPGGVEIDLLIPAGSRVSLKAVSANATTGEISINFLT